MDTTLLMCLCNELYWNKKEKYVVITSHRQNTNTNISLFLDYGHSYMGFAPYSDPGNKDLVQTPMVCQYDHQLRFNSVQGFWLLSL